MADTKISALTAASALGGGEALPAVQSGGNVRITPAQLLTYVLGAAATTEAVQDIVAGLLAASLGVTTSYDDAGNVLTIGFDPTNAAFVEALQDMIGGGFVTGASGVTVGYNDAGNTLAIGFDPTNAGFVEAVQDMIGGGFLAAGSGITLTYNDAANTLVIANANPKANTTTTDPTASNDSAAGYVAGSSWLNIATGLRWACLDASAGAAAWVPMGINDHPGYVSGYIYPAPSSVRASAAVAADTLYAARIDVKMRATVSGLSFNVGTVATGNARLGIYTSAAGRPGIKLAETAAQPSTGVTGGISASLAANVVLNPGVYWLACIFNAAPSILSIAASDHTQTEFIGGDTPFHAVASASAVTGVTGSGATYTGGLPSSFGAATVRYNAATPLLAINIA